MSVGREYALDGGLIPLSHRVRKRRALIVRTVLPIRAIDPFQQHFQNDPQRHRLVEPLKPLWVFDYSGFSGHLADHSLAFIGGIQIGSPPDKTTCSL